MIAIAHEFKIGVQCDGCGSSITTHWYRDMDIQEDCDLCSRCFESKWCDRTGFSSYISKEEMCSTHSHYNEHC